MGILHSFVIVMSEEAELEQLRRQKMAKAQQDARAQEAQSEQLRSALAQLLEPAAYERLMLVKHSSPERFNQVVQSISYLRNAGQLKGRLNDGQLRAVLVKLSAQEHRATSITFKRKGGDERRSE
jgi:programmed cell death protein 5